MPKIIIDIDDSLYHRLKVPECDPKRAWADIKDILEAFYNGKPLPDNATNGDVIKALFPDGSQVKGASIYVMNDNKSNIFYDFDWWNATYKKEE